MNSIKSSYSLTITQKINIIFLPYFKATQTFLELDKKVKKFMLNLEHKITFNLMFYRQQAGFYKFLLLEFMLMESKKT